MRMQKRYSSRRILSLLSACLLWGGFSSALHADIAVIVHPKNPVQTIAESDLQRIYMGRLRMFPESIQGIEAVDQPESSDCFVTFYQHLTGLSPAKLKRQRASYLFSGKGRLPTVKENGIAVKSHVAASVAAIGYVQTDQVDDSVKVVAIVKRE